MSSTTLPLGAEICHLRGGGHLAFARTGPLDAPVVVVLGGISAGRHVAAHAHAAQRGWWDEVVGPQLAIATTRYLVLSLDYLGGLGSSCLAEPQAAVTSADQADALAELLDALGIAQLHALVGASYGGMVGLQFAARHGERLRQLVTIAAAHASHAQASAWRAVQRRIVTLGIESGCGERALAVSRQLAMTTYRTPEELQQRFAGNRVALNRWLHARGEDFAARCTPQQFLTMLESIDGHRVDPAQIAVPTTTVAFHSDQLVPIEQVRELSAALPKLVRAVELPSLYGHDAFLKEALALTAVLREVLP